MSVFNSNAIVFIIVIMTNDIELNDRPNLFPGIRPLDL